MSILLLLRHAASTEPQRPHYDHMHANVNRGSDCRRSRYGLYFGIMPRQKKTRYCRGIEGYNLYKPAGVPMSQVEVCELGLDELEAMRLCDAEGHQQEEAAERMGVSRGTIQRLLESGRCKTISALVHGRALSFSDADHVCIGPLGRGRRGHRGGLPGTTR